MTANEYIRETREHIEEVSYLLFRVHQRLGTSGGGLLDVEEPQRAQLDQEIAKRCITHDASKLIEPEAEAFRRVMPRLQAAVYGSPEYHAALADLGEALRHHYAENRHHPEHFPGGIADMSPADLLEMLADWKASSKRPAALSFAQSFAKNCDRFGIAGSLRKLLEDTVAAMEWWERSTPQRAYLDALARLDEIRRQFGEDSPEEDRQLDELDRLWEGLSPEEMEEVDRLRDQLPGAGAMKCDEIDPTILWSPFVLSMAETTMGSLRLETALVYPDGETVFVYLSGGTLSDFGQTSAWLLRAGAREQPLFLSFEVEQNGDALELNAEGLAGSVVRLAQACVVAAVLGVQKQEQRMFALGTPEEKLQGWRDFPPLHAELKAHHAAQCTADGTSFWLVHDGQRPAIFSVRCEEDGTFRETVVQRTAPLKGPIRFRPLTTEWTPCAWPSVLAFYVSKENGNDEAGVGSREAPFLTIKRAAQALGESLGTIVVFAGVYQEEDLTLRAGQHIEALSHAWGRWLPTFPTKGNP